MGWHAAQGYRRVFAGKNTEIWQTDQAYPRLLTPATARLFAPGDIPSPAVFSATHFRDELLLTPRDEADRRLAAEAMAECRGRLHLGAVRSTPSRWAIHTRSDVSAWLVWSELDFPGWQADADGSPLPIHRANGMFRAICVPAGEHEIRMAFHPWSMVASIWRHGDD